MHRYRPTQKKTLFHFILAAGIALLLASPLQATAKSCKELPKTQCMSSNDCSWIKSYTTKSGSKVKAYCRNKPKKGKSSKKSNSKKKVANKTKKKSDKKSDK